MFNHNFAKFVNQLAEKTGKKALCEAVLQGYKICCEGELDEDPVGRVNISTDEFPERNLANVDVLENENEIFCGNPDGDEIIEDKDGLPQGTDSTFSVPFYREGSTPVPATEKWDRNGNTRLYRRGVDGEYVQVGGVGMTPEKLDLAAEKLSGIGMDAGIHSEDNFDDWN